MSSHTIRQLKSLPVRHRYKMWPLRSEPETSYHTIHLKDNKTSGVVNLLSNVGRDVYDEFYDELVKIKDDKDLRIYIATDGGPALRALKICRVLQSRKHRVSVYVKKCAHSCGTLLALCADEIYLDQNATLSPIDPQVSFDALQRCFPIKELPGLLAADSLGELLRNSQAYFQRELTYHAKTFAACINRKYNETQRERIMQHMFWEPVCHELLFFTEDLKGFGVDILPYTAE